MTREEAKTRFTIHDILNDLTVRVQYHIFCKFVDVIYDEFEAKIKALEAPKTCDGCEWDGSKHDDWSEHCGNCCRNVIQEDDLYEPKEMQ